MATSKSGPRIGYAPFSLNFTHPGDRRRFPAYARARNIPFELAQPDQSYDVAVLSEWADISVWPHYRRGKIVYDCIDSYLSIPRTDIKQMLRGLAWFASGRHRWPRLDFPGAIERMCRRADAVVCTTEQQKQTIAPLCANVHIVLDIHEFEVKTTKRDYRAGVPFNLVWEGLPSNLPYLKVVEPVLYELSRRRPLVLHIVTDPDRPRLFGRFGKIDSLEVTHGIFDDVVLHHWQESTFSEIITRCDLAVIPVPLNNPFSCGKPANKLALLWRMAMPVVTSATPAYQAMQCAAGLGHLACKDEADWLVALDRLMTAEAERREAGKRGHAFVTANLHTDGLLALWDDVFASLGFDFRGQAARKDQDDASNRVSSNGCRPASVGSYPETASKVLRPEKTSPPR
jgi:hypothetical protein